MSTSGASWSVAGAAPARARTITAKRRRKRGKREKDMTMLYKSVVIALALTGAVTTSGCMVHRDADLGEREDAAIGVSVGFGEIGFGYSDGYWDNAHRWHRWSNDGERQSYRNYQGNRYYDWNHDRDGDDGWRNNDVVVGVSVGFGEIGFGYNDGYWDNTHHWHLWANDGERAGYRSFQGNHYYDWNHDRDGGDGWRDN